MFLGWPRGRRKALGTVRLTIVNEDLTDNARLSIDGSTPVAVTYRPSSFLQLFASTDRVVNNIEIFDSTGYSARFALGASFDILFLSSPGGNSFFPIRIDAGERISLQPLAVPPVDCEVIINFFD